MAFELKRSWRLTLHASNNTAMAAQARDCLAPGRATLHIRDPHKERKMAAINEALGRCSADHPVFYEDEVDIHPNPKLGRTG